MVMKTALLAACMMLAAETQQVPIGALLGILKTEGGSVGQEVANTNGTHDLGPMQINTLWLPELADIWDTDKRTARAWVRDDACVNVQVAAWILRQKINEADGDIWGGITRYHSGTPHVGKRYRRKVVENMKGLGLLKPRQEAPAEKPAPATNPDAINPDATNSPASSPDDLSRASLGR